MSGRDAMIVIDGSAGEGGGQILRTSLTLSLVTGLPFRIEKIRAGRKTPGLLRQHLTAVHAAAAVSGAAVTGARIGSLEVTFTPGSVTGGDYRFAVGTAGSTTLVLQTVLPALLTASARSRLVLEGGTHNPFAPPFDFLAKTFLPLIERMGPRVVAKLERYGFYPAGGGKLVVDVEPAAKLTRLDLLERGEIRSRRARAIVSNLPRHVGERELSAVAEKLSWSKDCLEVESPENTQGPGNVLLLEIESDHVTEVFTGFGERGVPAEAVAESAVGEAQRYLAAGVPVGDHLADQLLVPMALAGGGAFVTLPLKRHTTTNIDIITRFLKVAFETSALPSRNVRVEVLATGLD